MKDIKKLLKRSSSAYEKKALDEICQHIDEISDAIELFKPENEEKRKIYDLRLAEQKKRQLTIDDIKETQHQMANQIKAREKNKGFIQLNTASLTELKDIEK